MCVCDELLPPAPSPSARAFKGLGVSTSRVSTRPGGYVSPSVLHRSFSLTCHMALRVQQKCSGGQRVHHRAHTQTRAHTHTHTHTHTHVHTHTHTHWEWGSVLRCSSYHAAFPSSCAREPTSVHRVFFLCPSPSSVMSIDATLCDRYVVFLDIDGVLLPVPKFTFGGGDLSEKCAQSLKRLITALGGRDKVTIVLSSTWRNHPCMVDRLNTFMQKEAGDGIPVVSESTPNGTVLVSAVTYYADDPSEQRLVRDRVDEVYRWLHTHITDHPEAIGGRWIAIDDMQLDVDKRMRGHFLHTQTDVGITEADVDTACAMIACHPSPEEAHSAAVAALADPALKAEEIEIYKVLQSRLEAQLAAVTSELTEVQEKVAALSAEKKDLFRELAEKQRSMEDMRYRLAVYEFSKRYSCLAAAVELAGTKTGTERRDMDAAIRAFVTLLMDRKELQKKIRSEAKRTKQAS
ncbi:hypothetical protein, conserved [Leishmania tarentolae]|uniref:Uncharacterized protein n=1 Tax=Leishmania tarentolae TaxID=5689 RepID=A0A640KHI0_LEITA|nr:hypothetical protein, conserved [Leishmania tarentolae]